MKSGLIIPGKVRLETDPSFASVSLLLHMDGSNGGTVFTDSGPAGLTMTPSNATTGTGTVKFGSASMQGTTTNAHLTPSATSGFAFPGLFTVEAWVYMDSTGVGHDIFCTSDSDGSDSFAFYIRGATSCPSIGSGTANILLPSDIPLSGSVWHHIAFTRDGSNNIRAFTDGVVSSTVGNSAISLLASTPKVGRNNYGAGSFDSGCFIDELRITKGVCRYTANFTPPTTAFPNS